MKVSRFGLYHRASDNGSNAFAKALTLLNLSPAPQYLMKTSFSSESFPPIKLQTSTTLYVYLESATLFSSYLYV